MDRLDAMRYSTRVLYLSSFTRAAEDLRLPRAIVSLGGAVAGGSAGRAATATHDPPGVGHARGRALHDSGLVGRRVAEMAQVICASPGYLAQRGMPTAPAALAQEGHCAVAFLSTATGRVRDMGFTALGGGLHTVALPARVSVYDTEAYLASAIAGLGLVQLPRYGIAQYLESGQLTEVLATHPPPPLPLYPTARQLAPRVRVLVDWVAQVLAAQLDINRDPAKTRT